VPRHIRALAILTAGFAVAFWVFFQSCKHVPALSAVNVFGNDPYDAVGSGGVQLAALAALLACIRAWRPYQRKLISEGQLVLLLRSVYVAALAAAVTLLADAISMARYAAVWIGSPAGHVLAWLVGGMMLVTAALGWLAHRTVGVDLRPLAAKPLWHALVATLIGTILLAFYPASWDRGIVGALATVLIAMVLLFVLVWAWATALAPPLDAHAEDLLDDLAAVYSRVQAVHGPIGGAAGALERIASWPWVRRAVGCLNPRAHPWTAVVLTALLMGMVLMLGELTGGEGPAPMSRIALVAAVFIGIEFSGVLIGYAILARPLGLFRTRG
jgi:hypothetical protein